MSSQLDSFDLKYQFVTAVDAQSPDFPRVLAESLLDTNGPWGAMSNPTVACTLSHLKAMDIISRGNDEYGLILEDDAKLSYSFKQFAENTNWIPGNADVIRLEHWNDPRQIIVVDRKYIGFGKFSVKRLRSRTAGCAAYIISKNLAKILIETPALLNMPIDHVLFNFGASAIPIKYSIFQLIPSVAMQDPSCGSDLRNADNSRVNKNNMRLELIRGYFELKQGVLALFRVAVGLSKVEKNFFEGKSTMSGDYRTPR